MKLRTLTLVGLLGLLGVWGCQEQAEEPAGEVEATAVEATADEAGAPADASPADVCKGIVEAAKAKSIDQIVGVSTQGAAEVLADQATQDGLMAALGDATCGEVTIAADDPNKATVKVTAGETSRDVPFLKADDWRFDVAGYLALFTEKPAEEAAAEAAEPPPPTKKARKGKRGKRKKGKRGKRKK